MDFFTTACYYTAYHAGRPSKRQQLVHAKAEGCAGLMLIWRCAALYKEENIFPFVCVFVLLLKQYKIYGFYTLPTLQLIFYPSWCQDTWPFTIFNHQLLALTSPLFLPTHHATLLSPQPISLRKDYLFPQLALHCFLPSLTQWYLHLHSCTK